MTLMFTKHQPTIDKRLQTEYEQNPPNCSGAKEAYIDTCTTIQTPFQKSLFRIGGGFLSKYKDLQLKPRDEQKRSVGER
jgi:hypothetical protein